MAKGDSRRDTGRKRTKGKTVAGPAKSRSVEAKLQELVSRLESAGEAERQNLQVFENLDVGLFRTELKPGGRILRANKALAKILGYPSVKNLLTVRASKAYHSTADRRGLIAEISRKGLVREKEVSFRRKDGVPIWVSMTARLIRDEHGRPKWLDGALIDITRRRQAEEALRASEHQYRTTMENSGEAIFTIDKDGVYRFANRQAAREVGVPDRGLVGRTIWDIFPKEVADARMVTVRRVLRTRRTILLVVPMPIGGKTVWLHSRFVPVSLPGRSRPDRVLIVARDVSELVEARDGLRIASDRLQYLIDNTQDVIFQIDLAGNFTFANRTAETMTGYPMSRIIGMNMRELIVPEKRDEIFARIPARIAGEPLVQPFRFEIVRRDGRRVLLELTTSRVLSEGQPVAIQGIARDVSRQAQAEQAVHKSEEQLRAIVTSLHGTVISVVDPEGVILDAWGDRDMAERTGMTAESFRGVDLRDVVPPEFARKCLTLLAEILSTGAPQRIAFPVPLPSGWTIWLEATVSPLNDSSGRPYAVVLFARDITDQKSAEDALADARHKLLNAREQERKHLAGELHDSVGQGLVSLQLAIQNAIVGEAGPADPVAQAQRCAAVADQCRLLVREVRQICHGLYPPTLEQLGLLAALEQLVKKCREGQVSTDFSTTPKLAGRRFSPDVEVALFRIAQEAIQNAMRHSQASHIDIIVNHQDGQVALKIEDDGCGFDISKAAGKGLGLALMNERAHAVGGSLVVSSSFGRTTVEVSVPAEPL